ncbi:unnamed protein product [Acanthoscelides obtectus]|uniref:MADF domain-containing protein n=1 Tax=Acanthoscelides obtectus TaxID=200917 RepID=A0A9P0K5W8_ACAOB|nr:unnamed protein product [Acanthoscelides obtectus]CAK1668885.1 hypothetical protein AOBTE_LOCUS26661 [Acanthoscelides obtectus]
MLGILGILDGGPLGQTLTVKFTCFIMDLWLKTGVLKKTAISATDAEMQGSNSNSHNDYKNRNKKHDATQESAQSFSCDATEVMRKWKTILAQYRREKKKIADSKSSGSGFSDLYKPRWFAYAYLNLFHGRDEPNTSMNSQDEINEQLIQEEHTTVNESQESSHERPLLREIQFVSSVTIISI